MTRDERTILGPLIVKVRKENLDTWAQLKEEIQWTPGPYSYGSPPTALDFEGPMYDELLRLPDEIQDELVRLRRSRPRDIELDSKKQILGMYAQIMVGELIFRACSAVARQTW